MRVAGVDTATRSSSFGHAPMPRTGQAFAPDAAAWILKSNPGGLEGRHSPIGNRNAIERVRPIDRVVIVCWRIQPIVSLRVTSNGAYGPRRCLTNSGRHKPLHVMGDGTDQGARRLRIVLRAWRAFVDVTLRMDWTDTAFRL